MTSIQEKRTQELLKYAEECDKTFKPDKFQIFSIINGMPFMPIPNSYLVCVQLYGKSMHGFGTKQISLFVRMIDNKAEFLIGTVIRSIILDKKKIKTITSNIIDSLKEKGKLPTDSTDFSFLDKGSIKLMLDDIFEANLGDYSFFRESKIFTQIEHDIKLKQSLWHISSLTDTIKQYERTAEDFSDAIDDHLPHLNKEGKTLDIDNYPRIKRLRQKLDLLFPPKDDSLAKQQRK